jgi:hypothetical protein
MKGLQFGIRCLVVMAIVTSLCTAVGSQIPTPTTYLYVPKITFAPEERRCLDCKTFAIVAIMRYYGEPVTFEDICREVGHPPGPRFEDVAFFGRLIQFVRSHGFVFEGHFWNVGQIIAKVREGYPVIAIHRFGEHPTEPGIVKGFNDSYSMGVGSARAYHTAKQGQYLHTCQIPDPSRREQERYDGLCPIPIPLPGELSLGIQAEYSTSG